MHDLNADQQTLAVEAIVNTIMESLVQTLLKIFQYKSISSLYKMLREKTASSLRYVQDHFELCKNEMLSRLQDPILAAKFGNVVKYLSSTKCSSHEYLSIDYLLKGEEFLRTVSFRCAGFCAKDQVHLCRTFRSLV